MFVWVNGQFNPSDINSKICTDFTQSKLWLNGPPFFLKVTNWKVQSGQIWQKEISKRTVISHIGALQCISMKKKSHALN